MANLVHIANVFILGQVTSTPPAGPAAGNDAALGIESAFDFLIKGGWAMIPIGLCSLVALTIIVERMMVLRKARVMPRSVVEHLKSLAGDSRGMLDYCRTVNNPFANIVQVAVKDADEPQLVMEKHVEEAGSREVVALRKHMRVLSTLPQVATMLGLLGTVFGMIKTFQAVAATSEALGKTEMLAKGIFEAWTCTAAGLLVAVPVLIAYHHLMGRIDALVAELDRSVGEWMEQRKSLKSGARQLLVDVHRSPEPSVDGQASPVLAASA